MTGWTEEGWALFFDLLDKGWPGELDPADAPAYRVLLDGTDPEHVVQGVRRLLHQGARFRPSAAEILAAGRRDPSRPTFAEALRLIFGPRGVLAARPPRDERRYNDAAERTAAERTAAAERAAELHPVIASFVRAQGIDRLRGLQLDDPDWGAVRRKELEAEFNAHVDRLDERQVAVDALPAGDSRRGQLARLDPLAALERARPAGALGAGSIDPTEEIQHAHDG